MPSATTAALTPAGSASGGKDDAVSAARKAKTKLAPPRRSTKAPIPTSMGDKKWASALFDFAGEDVGDLAFQAGDLLEVVDSRDSDWWKGKLKGVGKIGSFPSNYAELIFGTGKMKRARATFDFSAEDPAEISFSAGDMISVLLPPMALVEVARLTPSVCSQPVGCSNDQMNWLPTQRLHSKACNW